MRWPKRKDPWPDGWTMEWRVQPDQIAYVNGERRDDVTLIHVVQPAKDRA